MKKIFRIYMYIYPKNTQLQDAEYGHTYILRLDYRDASLTTLCQMVPVIHIKKIKPQLLMDTLCQV